MVDHRDPDPALTDGKGFPLKMFAPTVTEIELTTVRSMTLDMHAHFTHVRTHAETSQRLSVKKNVQRISLRTHICMSLQRLYYFLSLQRLLIFYFPERCVCVCACVCVSAWPTLQRAARMQWSLIYNYIMRV